MALELHLPTFLSSSLRSSSPSPKISTPQTLTLTLRGPSFRTRRRRSLLPRSRSFTVSASLPTLDLTEDNIRKVLIDAKSELAQIFDGSVGITGQVDLAELDGPYVKLRLKGRFWHTRATVVARVGNYLKNRIPDILEVDIEDDKQLDDSPANF
ncbi:uncharacterized protein LOC109711981 [Ananas comosus]|uniref:Uncharacterized protein LOC109711981 n=1 Tax=Ananas comosus TaxID=4615 RepID=A0A6P5F5S1_ANACO|nr:uncharacterized protein LOC109711981 [Ananas comosus]XP_020090961.1 uncharacterized protein LOC109711981 [Ananas comosus]XP_020090962.1 uncharacterized protein LOC109711981 [Ananas comosus]XP_020090963.1 uncharacterized protein LOC109711981 [Ananas comosus]